MTTLILVVTFDALTILATVKKINVYRITKYFLTITKTGFIILLIIIEDFGISLNSKFQNELVGQMSSFEFLGWLFASQKSGFSGLRYRFIPSLRFGTGFASP
ncbi:MAG: hypothetical protein MR739_06630, partial [Spirochaetia bacterium]|nr:hypothetical protein [Spirochaetia bacterium]